MIPRLSVIIATQGRPERLRRVLDGLAAQTDQCFETILIGDGFLPPSVSCRIGRRRISAKAGGTGAAKVRNDALRLATAPRTLIIDDDCVLHPEAVERHSQGQDCIIGTRLHVGQAAVEGLPDAPVTWKDLLPLVVAPDDRDAHIRKWGQRVKDHSNIAYTCHLSFPTDKAKQVGGFWEEMVASGFEDVEFALRLGRAGVAFQVPSDLPPVLHLDHPRCHRQIENFQDNKKKYLQTKTNASILERNGGLAHFGR